uniref:Uncharacterized protein n=1 Tax=Cacopsylla melanoneura TaxID=428564 RepID=A0A8D9BH49_9HEMI
MRQYFRVGTQHSTHTCEYIYYLPQNPGLTSRRRLSLFDINRNIHTEYLLTSITIVFTVSKYILLNFTRVPLQIPLHFVKSRYNRSRLVQKENSTSRLRTNDGLNQWRRRSSCTPNGHRC